MLLDVWQVTAYDGEPQALDSQALTWARPDDLPNHDLLEADRAIVTALRLPRLARVLAPGETLQSLRRQRGADDPRGGCPSDGTRQPRCRSRGGGARRGPSRIRHWHRPGCRARSRRSPAATACCCAGSARACTSTATAPFSSARTARTPKARRGGRRGRALPRDRAGRRRRCRSSLLERLCEMIGRPVFAGWYPDARRLERSAGAWRRMGAHVRAARACGRRSRGSFSSRGCRCRGS